MALQTHDITTATDWISPLYGILGNMAFDGNALVVPMSCGYTGREVTGLLHKRKIKTWGEMLIQEYFFFSVENAKRSRAESILWQAGIQTGFVADIQAEMKKQQLPQEGQQQQTYQGYGAYQPYPAY